MQRVLFWRWPAGVRYLQELAIGMRQDSPRERAISSRVFVCQAFLISRPIAGAVSLLPVFMAVRSLSGWPFFVGVPVWLWVVYQIARSVVLGDFEVATMLDGVVAGRWRHEK